MKNPTHTVRLTNVIEQSGKPKFVSLWGKPDAAFLAAVKQNRVVTVKLHPVGNRAEFGVVGFQKENNVLYLEFPKSLNDFNAKRIVGIKLELVEEEGVTGKSTPRPTSRTQIRKPIPPPEGRFTVVIRSTIAVDTSYDIKARNKTAAEAKAQEAAKFESLDLSTAKIKRTILRTTPGTSSSHKARI